eukprot:3457691-Pyramimonas_sp.AAC.1
MKGRGPPQSATSEIVTGAETTVPLIHLTSGAGARWHTPALRNAHRISTALDKHHMPARCPSRAWPVATTPLSRAAHACVGTELQP